MAKRSTTSYVCQECGYDTPSWLGKCPECGSWNSFKEFQISNSKFQTSNMRNADIDRTAKTLPQITSTEKTRLSSGFSESDTVLGGGIVKGSVSLLAGDPGVGKSTLLLQLAINIAKGTPAVAKAMAGKEGSNETEETKGKKVLYISGEESEEQIKMRASRLLAQQKTKNLKLKTSVDEHLLILSQLDVDAAVTQIEKERPAFVVIDSIQTLQSTNVAGLAGSVGQVRYSALHIIRIAKALQIPVIIVGHVTKEGMVAGPMVLSHMVDTVLFLEGEKFSKTRILRSLKNRFGPVDEVGIFLMEEEGMVEVTHPEQMFLTSQTEQTPGSVLVATMEGTRAFLVEIQALALSTRLPMPRRVVSGLDSRRVELLLAVLQKHCRLPIDSMDIFVNVAGGMKLSDPAVDLGVCLAVFSSIQNIPLKKTVGIAEVGLLGELRTVTGLEKRIREAGKMGYKTIISTKEFKTLRDVVARFSK